MQNLYSAVLDSNDAFSAANHADFRPAGAFTVGGYLKLSSSTAYRMLFSSSSILAGLYGGFDLFTNNNHTMWFRSCKNTGVGAGHVQDIFGSSVVDDGAWHWIVVTWNTTHLNMYFDGQPDSAPVAWAYAPGYSASNAVRVGSEYATSESGFLNGSHDEVFLINGAAWSDAKVASMYKKFLTGEPYLKAYYQSENNGNDSSGNGHNLTDIGDPAYALDPAFIVPEEAQGIIII